MPLRSSLAYSSMRCNGVFDVGLIGFEVVISVGFARACGELDKAFLGTRAGRIHFHTYCTLTVHDMSSSAHLYMFARQPPMRRDCNHANESTASEPGRPGLSLDQPGQQQLPM